MDLCIFRVSFTYRNHFDSNILEYVDLYQSLYQRVWNYNFSYRDKNEGVLKVKGSYVLYGSDKCADISNCDRLQSIV